MPLPSVTVAVLNYNGKEHLESCLSSLLALDYPAELLEVIVIDNDSSDGSLEFVRERYPAVVTVQNGHNYGFAEGNNRGVRGARGEFLAFLNNDMRVDPAWLRELVKPAMPGVAGVDGAKPVGAVASLILDWDGERVDFAGAAMNFTGWGSQERYGSSHTDQVGEGRSLLFACGGAMLVRRELFEQLGGFDPDYFAFYEDVDLGWRIWLTGRRVMFAPRSVAYHRHHGSWNRVGEAARWMLAERNTLTTIVKNYDDTNLAHVLPAALLLVGERVYLEIYHPLPDGPAAGGVRYYAGLVGRLLRDRDYRELASRIRSELERRTIWVQQRLLGRTIWPRPVPETETFGGGGRDVPVTALGRLAGAVEVLQAWEQIQQKRGFVQGLRERSDAEIFPLFRTALLSNFPHPRFIQAMSHTAVRFELTGIFRKKPAAPASEATREKSRAVSLQLLHAMQRVLEAAVAAGAPSSFQIGGPMLPETIQMPESALEPLRRINAALWYMPVQPLAEALDWLGRALSGGPITRGTRGS